MNKELENRLEELFCQIKEINPVSNKRRQTFMEVAGYPHFENVISNILAFLFTDSEEHGMQDLWLRSLLEAAGKEKDIIFTGSFAEREVLTDKRNRIDILVTTGNGVVCIENKIYAEVYNNLEDYKAFAESRVNVGDNPPVCVILSLVPIDKDKCGGFINVTYEQLFEQVGKNLSEHLPFCDNTWLIYVKDFMATVYSLNGKEEQLMDKEFERWYKSNYSYLRELDDIRADYLNEIRSEAQNLCNAIISICDEENLSYNPKLFRPQTELRASVYIDFTMNDDKKTTIAAETSRNAWGWNIAFLTREKDKKRFEKVINKINDEMKIEIPIPESEGAKIEGHHIVKTITSENAEKPKDVAREMINIIKEYIPRINNAYSRPDLEESAGD